MLQSLKKRFMTMGSLVVYLRLTLTYMFCSELTRVRGLMPWRCSMNCLSDLPSKCVYQSKVFRIFLQFNDFISQSYAPLVSFRLFWRFLLSSSLYQSEINSFPLISSAESTGNSHSLRLLKTWDVGWNFSRNGITDISYCRVIRLCLLL